MENKEYNLTITEIQDVLESTVWKEFVAEATEESEKGKWSVLLSYLDKEFTENSVYTPKNVAARQLIITINLKERFEWVELSGMKKFVSHLDEQINNYEIFIKNTLNADTFVQFTETDVLIREVNTKIEYSKWFEKKVEEIKKPKEDDNVMDRVRE